MFFCGIVAVGLGPAIWLGSTLFRAPSVQTPPMVAVTADPTTSTGTPDPTTADTDGPLDPPSDGGGWPTGPGEIRTSMPGVGLPSAPSAWPSQTPPVTTSATPSPTGQQSTTTTPSQTVTPTTTSPSATS